MHRFRSTASFPFLRTTDSYIHHHHHQNHHVYCAVLVTPAMLLGLQHFVAAVVLCAVSTVMCGPMPRPLWIDDDDDDDDKRHQARQNERVIDRFATKLVSNRRVRENYLDCFLENGPCSPEASNIKRKCINHN